MQAPPAKDLRVALLIRSLEVGGAEVQLVALARGLQRKGHTVSVITFYPGGSLEPLLRNEGIAVLCPHKRGRWDLLSFAGRLWRVLRRLRPHVLHTFLGGPNLFGALLKPFLPRTRVVWGVRASDMDLNRYDWTWRAMFRAEGLLSRVPDWIVANSNAGRDFIAAQGFRKDHIAVIPNGIDTDRFRPDRIGGAAVRAEWRVPAGMPLIGLVARIDPMKGHATFLEAAALLRARLPDARFVCVGNGPVAYAQEMRALAAKLAMDSAVIWAGERHDIPAVLSALDLATLTSITEGFPNALCEAMACAHGCVTTDVGDAAMIVGDTGIVVPRADARALADAWERTLQRPAEQQREMGLRARRRVEENFSVETMVTRTAAVYAQVIAGSAAPIAARAA